MRLDKAFGTDKTLEEGGKWFDLGDNARVLVGRFGNKNHERVMDRLRKPYEAMLLRKQKIPKEEMSDMIRASFAEGVMMGWEGFVDEEGKAIPFSKDEALNAITLYKDFYDLLFDFSNDMANFRSYVEEEVVKK